MTEITDLIADIQDLVTTFQALGTDLTETDGLSVIGVAGNTTAPVDAITASANGDVLQMAGGVLVWAPIAGSSIPNDTISNAMIRNSTALSVIGRSANSIGDPADIAGSEGQYLGIEGGVLAFTSNVARLSQANIFTSIQTVTNDIDSRTATPAFNLRTGGGSLLGRFYSSSGDQFLESSNSGASFAITTTGGGALTLNGVNVTDYARLSQNNTFTGDTQTISGGNPQVRFNETDAAADNRLWLIQASGESLFFDAYNDAVSSGTSFMAVTRTGNAIDTISLTTASGSFGAGDISFNGVSTADIPRKSQSNTFTGQIQTISHTAPVLAFYESDAGSDEKLWYVGAHGVDQLLFATRTDAGAAGSIWLQATRTGTTVDSIALAATEFAVNASPPSGLYPQIICRTLQLDDDATGSITVPVYATIHVVSSYSGSADIIASFTATAEMTSVYTGVNATIGTGANPDTDAKANYWKSANTTFSIKNRLGSARFFRIFVMGGE